MCSSTRSYYIVPRSCREFTVLLFVCLFIHRSLYIYGLFTQGIACLCQHTRWKKLVLPSQGMYHSLTSDSSQFGWTWHLCPDRLKPDEPQAQGNYERMSGQELRHFLVVYSIPVDEDQQQRSGYLVLSTPHKSQH